MSNKFNSEISDGFGEAIFEAQERAKLVDPGRAAGVLAQALRVNLEEFFTGSTVFIGKITNAFQREEEIKG